MENDKPVVEKKLVILVDDNPANLRIGKNVLSEKYTVATAPSAAKLFGLLENNRPNLILLDIDMPEMDGYEAITILKSKPETKNIPVIFLTGMTESRDEAKGRSLGAADYITKPFDPPLLIDCIEKHTEVNADVKGNEKVLIILVDDNPSNLQIGKNALAEKYVVATVPSAAKLFSLLENNSPAMILLDVDMPEMNGYQTIKILKSNPKTKNIPVIFVTGRTESDDELAGLSLGAIDYITKPFQPPLLRKRIEVHLLVEAQREKLEKQAAELQDFNDNLQMMVKEKTKNIQDLQNALLNTMAELVEYRDDVTGGHIERTQRGIKIILTEIERSSIYQEEIKGWDVDLLLQSSQLHDVGKIFIEDNILKKAGKLNEDEFFSMKKHAAFGEQIIEKIETMAKESDFLKYARIFASSHHEKWDGTGYPLGLKGNEIPLLGRIMAIADVYDALTSVRPYKNAFSHEEAVRTITAGSGTQFDPLLVEVFNKTADQFKQQR